MKRKKIDTTNMTAVEIYKLILDGDLSRFPRQFWFKPESLKCAAEITQYLIEEKLKLSDDELKKQLSVKLFRNNKLYGMISILFSQSPFDAIDNTYPDKFKPWEFNDTPNKYWNHKTAAEAVKWLIEEKLKLSDEQLKDQMSKNLFINNGLYGMIEAKFIKSPFDAIDNAYPKKFKQWEFNQVPDKYWNYKTAAEAVKWLIEEKLKLSDEEVKDQLSVRLFLNNKLYGVTKLFNGSPFKVIDNAYPGKFKILDFKGYNYNKKITGIIIKRKKYRD